MKAVLFVLAAVFAVAVTADVNIPFTNCGEGVYKVESLTAPSWPPKAGADLFMTSHGDLRKELTGGDFVIKTTYSGIEVQKDTGEICAYGDVACPTKAGAVSITSGGNFPSNAPSGTYKIQSEFYNQDRELFACYTITFST